MGSQPSTPSHGAGEDVASSTQNPGDSIQDSAPPNSERVGAENNE